MAIFENNLNINQFLQITSGGVQVARFDEVRDALIRNMQNIYGTDIDISPASADGQWVNQIALIINNCLQTIKYSFDMLDPASATGKYLDIICSFNNIERIMPTASKAQLLVKNISGIPQNEIPSILFVDKGGNYWKWTNPKNANGDYEFKWNENAELLLQNVECQTLGEIIAPGTGLNINEITKSGTSLTGWDALDGENGGYINQTIDFGIWKVYQKVDAEIGYNEETDESLRSRRIQSLGNQSVSVLSGLKGALLNIDGIDDVYILNNPSAREDVGDGTSANAHTVYICIRYRKNANITNFTIGELIYNKLTPGIPTVAFNKDGDYSNTGENEIYEIQKSPTITYIINWKKCLPCEISNITISLKCSTKLYDFTNDAVGLASHSPNTTTEKNIASQIINYLNNIKINEKITAINLMTATQKGDILKQGLPTFTVSGTNVSSDIDMHLAYCEISEENIKFSYTAPAEGSFDFNGTITINAYLVKSDNLENGKIELISPDYPSIVIPGNTIKFKVIPNEGYSVGTVSIIGDSQTVISYDSETKTYSFTMPNHSCIISSTFTESE